MITRRGFIGGLIGLVSTTAVVTGFPLHHLPEMMKQDASLKFLHRVVTKWAYGKPLNAWNKAYLVCSAGLYDAYWREVPTIQRISNGTQFTPTTHGNPILFKGMKVFKVKNPPFYHEPYDQTNITQARKKFLISPNKNSPASPNIWWAEVREGLMPVL